jgi:23S rRNA pseudouridine2605 synthase
MSSRPQPPLAAEAPAGVRLQKALAAAGLGSRRECEELILAGRVEVDREVVSQLGTRVDPRSQEIRVDGEVLRPPHLTYYALHKPPDVVCTARDPSGRPRAIDLVPPEPRVFAVGRLDLSSEGLLLLTNDGDLANGLTHPRHEVEKIYRVLVAGRMGEEELAKLRRGMHLAEGFAKPRRIRIVSSHPKRTWLEMVLDEGRNREIRRLLARVGHKVQRLVRIAVGSLRLGELPRGAYRPLHREEIDALRRDIADSRRRHRMQKHSRPRDLGPSDTGPNDRPSHGRKRQPRREKALAGATRESGGQRPRQRSAAPAAVRTRGRLARRVRRGAKGPPR